MDISAQNHFQKASYPPPCSMQRCSSQSRRQTSTSPPASPAALPNRPPGSMRRREGRPGGSSDIQDDCMRHDCIRHEKLGGGGMHAMSGIQMLQAGGREEVQLPLAATEASVTACVCSAPGQSPGSQPAQRAPPPPPVQKSAPQAHSA